MHRHNREWQLGLNGVCNLGYKNWDSREAFSLN